VLTRTPTSLSENCDTTASALTRPRLSPAWTAQHSSPLRYTLTRINYHFALKYRQTAGPKLWQGPRAQPRLVYRVLLPFYRKNRFTEFGAVGYIITLYSSKSYAKSWKVRPNFGEVRTPDPPVVAPMAGPGVTAHTALQNQVGVPKKIKLAPKQFYAYTNISTEV